MTNPKGKSEQDMTCTKIFKLKPWLLTMSAALLLAAPVQAKIVMHAPNVPQTYCAQYASLKNPKRAEALKAQILGAEGYVVPVLILGTPNHLKVTANGIDLKKYKVGEKALVCGAQRAGFTAYYDLSSLRMDAAVIEVKADDVKAKAKINLTGR